MEKIKPKKLTIGSTIGLLSISGSIKERFRIDIASQYFEDKGFRTKISDTTDKRFRYHSGNDEERLRALHEFFEDDSIDAIICTRGGFGVTRLLKNIDWELIKSHPKFICGYSDITALLLMIYKKTRMITFHGAMANGDFGEDKMSGFTEKSFFETLAGKSSLKFGPNKNSSTLCSGTANGILWGGNLTTVSSLAGLDFIPDEKFIFFTEDLNEPAYKIDRMFTQLLNIEKFRNNLAGIAIGEFKEVDRGDFVKDMFTETAVNLQIPASDGFLISHEQDKYTLPIGAECLFNADEKTISVTEKYLAD